jgi:hypothetical protein
LTPLLKIQPIKVDATQSNYDQIKIELRNELDLLSDDDEEIDEEENLRDILKFERLLECPNLLLRRRNASFWCQERETRNAKTLK